ncbi:unnamed protein product [Heligmosomoides polygyrus]|uniref:Ig-like domain-containing protein n=1 Tax=Heligmosomoides polygyrus TaxID=6339 RepID=A0A183G207_HELPZ|nr:unnamed protein product [Heligmosomoides polygyrus]
MSYRPAFASLFLLPTLRARPQGAVPFEGAVLFHQIWPTVASFSPAPKPTWYHNGREISEDTDEGFRFESYGKTLVFNVTQDKAGKYDCRFPVHNDIDRSFNVVVEAAPYWPDGPPPNTNTSEGETVTFDCTTSGKPMPKVTFYKNGVGEYRLIATSLGLQHLLRVRNAERGCY